MKGKIADPSLASEGERSYSWAYKNMPALVKTIESFGDGMPLRGRKVAMCLHVTKETSVLAMGLKRLGADVYLSAANPLTTQDDIAAYLSSQGVNVFAWRGENQEEYFSSIESILRAKPDIIMDDGSDAHVTFHEEKEFSDHKVMGGTEETTTGVTRLRALSKAGKLRYPVIAVNNAYTKFLFDNRYGTGQSTFDGLLRATSLLIAGKKVVVAGYGWVGKGIAKRARGLDAHVIVTEVDPLKALEAHMDGYEVMLMGNVAELGDVFITATGQINVIRGEHLEKMKDGVILANAGHFNVEIDVNYLKQNSISKKSVRCFVDEYLLKNGKRLYLIGDGRIVNLVAAEGHPPEVMMMSFSNQLLSVVNISENHSSLEKKVYDVPESIDKQVAKNALEAMGIKVDEITEEQRRYASEWKV
ncbi:MAG: adenosylhomocysteinase [Candidatus Methylarchaceae archaeon HK01B]|nr:adenosylhomocysteinase [Candidatus Methylarchaceae archaeon HK02M1]MCP8318852.1 adenosylhomocysteinase [Candidatus Methylarchaceae archaeon HK01B]